MKEITRRLYRKPFILGAALVLGMTLLAGLFVTANSRAASTYIPAGDDRFETTDNGETFHNFAGSPIPAGFFNTDGQSTSDPYAGVVPLEGSPLPGQGDIDTIIRRNQAVYTPGSTSIQIVGLSLVSISPITVSYSDRPPEDWNMAVGLSDFKASTGTMTISDGGTFDSSLGVFFKLIFTRVSDGAQKVLDSGAPGGGLAPLTAGGGDETVGTLPKVAVIAPGPSPAPDPAPTAVPGPTAVPAPCIQVASDDVDVHDSLAFRSTEGRAAAAAAGCPPVTLTSNNSPWAICGFHFCIPRPITEQEILASHFASPPGTKRRRIQ